MGGLASSSLIEGSTNGREELFVRKGFGQIFFRSSLNRFDRALNGGITRNHHDLEVAPVFPDVSDQIEATCSGHLEVGDDEVDRGLLKKSEGLRHTGDGEGLVSLQ
jgi:hypothetical protein